jgi:hypothetical protein
MQDMGDRPASWRMPTPKQMEKLAAKPSSPLPVPTPTGPTDEMPPGYWDAVLSDPRAQSQPTGKPLQQRCLADISLHVLRVSCSRCERIVEIQRADAIRMFGGGALWKDVGQRILYNTCDNRTGRHEDDGCWPSFENT